MFNGIAKELTCFVCQEDFKDPRALPCGHSYCLECIAQLSKVSPLQFPCPECHKEIVLPSSDPSQLPRALLAVRIRRKLNDKNAREGECLKHGEKKRLFCFDCDFLICFKCDLTDHSDHDTQLVESLDITERVRGIADALAEGKTNLAQRKSALIDACQTNRRARVEVCEQEERTKDRIDATFEELFHILRQRKERLLEELGACAERKKAALDEQERALRDKIWEAEQTNDTVDLVAGNTEKLLEWHKLLLSSVNGVIHQSARNDLEPATVADMGFPLDCTSRIASLIRAECRIVSDSPAHPTAKAVGIKPIVDVMSPVPVTIIATCTTNSTTAESVVTARLLHVGSHGTCDVLETDPGTFQFSYCAANRGHYKLHVEMNGQQLTGSPYTVLATIPPRKLGKKIRVIPSLHSLTSMVVSHDDLLVGTEGGDKPRVVLMDKYGENAFYITSEHILCPTGVAVDGDNNIYVVDTASNSLLKFEQNGTLLKMLDCPLTSPWRFSTARDIGIANNEYLLVCDFEGHRILVFDTDLSFIYTFGSYGHKFGELNNPAAIAYSKKSGHVFVADVGNHRVHVFTLDGNPIKFFKVLSSKGKPINSFHICLDLSEEFLFIGDISTSNILVFTINGKHVTSFCSKGKPIRTAVDNYGYVYVFDSEHNKIVVF